MSFENIALYYYYQAFFELSEQIEPEIMNENRNFSQDCQGTRGGDLAIFVKLLANLCVTHINFDH